MARIARVVVPYHPHHITQRGCRRQQTFFSDQDYRYYFDLLAKTKNDFGVQVWAYCLMPNHVHLVIVPEDENALAPYLGRAHRQYALHINRRNGWSGHLWQERFHSFVMDENYLLATVRYTELNPVRSQLCARADQWPWSSALAHLNRISDQLVDVEPMLNLVNDWGSFLQSNKNIELDTIRKHSKSGRPAGHEGFLSEIEITTGRVLRKIKPGPKGN